MMTISMVLLIAGLALLAAAAVMMTLGRRMGNSVVENIGAMLILPGALLLIASYASVVAA